MARKPNYRFERLERERKKADKKAAKLEAKRDTQGDGAPSGDESVEDDSGTSGTPAADD